MPWNMLAPQIPLAGSSAATLLPVRSLACMPLPVSAPPPLSHPAQPSPPPFDVYLTDAEMPVMDGYAMMTLLRARGDRTPAIGITGNALPVDVRRFLDAGVQAVVTKPVAMAELMSALRRLVPWLSDAQAASA
jgi:CheY-like chemotaxis protein